MKELFDAHQCQWSSLAPVLAERATWIERKQEIKFQHALDNAPKVKTQHLKWDSDFIEIGQDFELDESQTQALLTSAKALIPWKKGPFRLFGLEIDGEWRSDYKWQRLINQLPPMQGKRILDIGCNNGYFMLRMLAHNPAFVLGIDPVVRTWAQFQFLRSFFDDDRLHYQMLGIEHLNAFNQAFDIIFSMGIIYHHRHPLEQLATIYQALSPGGYCVLETIGIPGTQSVALFPDDRYAKMRNVWFVPTLPCLINWARRSRFKEVEVLHSVPLTVEEQRQTSWCLEGAESLADFLDPQNPNLTIEGHPAPYRMTLLIRRPKDS